MALCTFHEINVFYIQTKTVLSILIYQLWTPGSEHAQNNVRFVIACPSLDLNAQPSLLHIMACVRLSPAMWSLNGDHIAGTTFLYKIVPSVNLQNTNQLNIKCIVCYKNNKRVFNLSVDITFIVSGGLLRCPDAKTTRVFSTQRLSSCLLLL